jgi:hypothetical protein
MDDIGFVVVGLFGALFGGLFHHLALIKKKIPSNNKIPLWSIIINNEEGNSYQIYTNNIVAKQHILYYIGKQISRSCVGYSSSVEINGHEKKLIVFNNNEHVITITSTINSSNLIITKSNNFLESLNINFLQLINDAISFTQFDDI